jgi:hypothetical protein
MALQMWDCPCGRSVPGRVDTCRCGRPRPAASIPRVAVAEPPSQPSASIYQSTGLRAVGALLVMVLGYFGSRACNREMTSRDARRQAEDALTRSLGAEGAKTAMNRYHRDCFSATYRTGWGRRQSSKFDDAAYVACLVARVEGDRTLANGASVEPTGVAAPAPARPAYDASGPLRIRDARIFFYEPPGHVVAIRFNVSGQPLPRLASAVSRTLCDGTPLHPDFFGRFIQFGIEGDYTAAVAEASVEDTRHCRSVAIEVGIAVETPRPPRRQVLVSNSLIVRIR